MGLKGILKFVALFIGVSVQLMASLNTNAAVAPDFFRSDQKVESQSKQQRTQAINRGFTEILIKLTGSSQILLRPELRGPLQNAQSYLETYSYFTKTDTKAVTSSDTPQAERAEQWIRLDFNGPQIEAIFYEQKLPLWSKDRPPLVFWFGIDAGQGRSIVSAKSNISVADTQVQQAIIQSAARRGLSVLWPTMDEQDQQTIHVSDIWSLDMNAVTNASRRYNAQLVVLGKMSLTPSGAWYGQWGIEYEGRADWHEGSADSFTKAVDAMIDSFAGKLGETYSFEVGHDHVEKIILAVEGINDLKAYAQVSKLLDGLMQVSHVAVREAMPGRILFEVVVQGGVAQLLPSLKLQPRLRSIAAPVTPRVDDAVKTSTLESEPSTPLETVLNYRWLGS